mmetsp:Transcript_12635/g.40628  ORF Transcript_12635/g.40628 Transcript_12635/m.40628 type:complete len:210 (-) Transcript_12635:27-656(-)
MAKLALLLLAPAAALVPSKTASSSTRLAGATLKDPKSSEFAYGLPGNKIPGNELSSFDFDPLGFAERASPADMVKYREAELKHGRVAMLATIGYTYPEAPWAVQAFPGDAYSHANPIKAAIAVPPGAWANIIFFVGLMEFATNRGKMTMMEMFEDPKRVPGDLGWDPMGLYADDKKEKYQMAELQHGRLAMLAAAGMIVQELQTGSTLF